MDKGKLFMNGKSQAVRLPKKYRFDSDEVFIQEHPMGVLLIDPKKRWDLLESLIGSFGEDFFSEGLERLPTQEREDF